MTFFISFGILIYRYANTTNQNNRSHTIIKRKTSQTYWELESIYYRACRITGFKPDTEAYKDLDYKDAIIILKRLIVKTISSI